MIAPGLLDKDGMGLIVSLLIGSLGFSCYALWVGQDANWDLQNYHLYAAYALLHWRYPLDVGPGGFQTYLNPLPYLWPYFVRSTLQPPVAAAGLALSQAFVVPAIWLMTGAMPRISRSVFLRASTTLAAATSATALSEVGTSFADLTLASLVVVSAFMLCRPDTLQNTRGRFHITSAGFLLGMATGLKLTNGIYLLGYIVSLLVSERGFNNRSKITAASIIGAVSGLSITGGVGAIYLYVIYGNPIFPGMNSWFHSPSAALSDFTDKRFLPSSVFGVLSYPFQIASGGHPTAENPFADPRLAVFLTTSSILLVTELYRYRAGYAAIGRIALYRAVVFVWVSYLVWVLAFAIERYAVALEIIASILSMEIISGLVGRRFQAIGCLTTLIGVLSFTRPADWWHRPWNDAFTPRVPPSLLAPAAFMIVSSPDGYWATILPEASRFYMVMPVGLATGGPLRAQLVAGLQDASGHRVWTLGFDVPMAAPVRANMAALGYAPAAPCVRSASLWWIDTIFCHAAAVGKRPWAAADLKHDETVDFTSSGPGWIYEVAGWTNAVANGTSTIGLSAELALSPEPSASKSVLEFDFHDTPPGYDTQVLVNGRTMAAWRPTEGQNPRSQTVCLPDLAESDGVADLVLRTEAGKPFNFTLQSMTLRSARKGECGI